MTAIPVDMNLSEILHIVTESGHSRFPVLSSDKDEVEGILHAKDFAPISRSRSKF